MIANAITKGALDMAFPHEATILTGFPPWTVLTAPIVLHSEKNLVQSMFNDGFQEWNIR